MIDAAKSANEVLDALVGGEYEALAARFSGMMRTAVPPDVLRRATEEVFAQLGPLRARGEPAIRSMGGHVAASISCECERGAFELQIVFDGDSIAGMLLRPKQDAVEHPPPRYAPGGSFEEREITVGTGEWALPATFTLPRKRKKKKLVPAVVLVHGSGPNDRDETVGGSKVFLDLAWGLAARGIASIRYEKRTRAHGERIDGDITVTEEVLDDAVSAVEVARAQPEVGAVYVCGHSLGGTLAPAIAARAQDVAGVIVLAGATRPIGAIVLDQMRYLLGDGDLSEIEKQCVAADDPALSVRTSAKKLPLGMTARYILSLREHAPERWAESSAQPMLVLHGERDYQVTAADLEGWKRIATARAGVTIKTFPDLNHLFAKGSGPSRPEEYEQPANVDERVVKEIAGFIG